MNDLKQIISLSFLQIIMTQQQTLTFVTLMFKQTEQHDLYGDIFPCDTNYNVIESPSHAHITIDCYS